MRVPLAVVVALIAVAVCAPSALAKSPSEYLAADQILLNHYAEIESGKLGLTLPGGVEKFITLSESPQHTLPERGPDGTVFPGAADTTCTDAQGNEVGPAVHCTITVSVSPHVSNSKGEPTKNLAVIDPEIRSTIAHEVFHCYQTVMAGTLANFNRPEATWLIEGSATWVESDLVPDDSGAREEWATYLKSPEVSLLKRTYTAVGFFEHLDSSGISPWSRFQAMFAATSNAAAYNVSVSRSAAFLNTEASAFFREPSLGSEWDTRGPSVPTREEVGFKPTKEKISGRRRLSASAYADGAYEVSVKLPKSAPVLELQVLSGDVRLRSTDGGDVNEVDPDTLKLCSDSKGCDCPGKQPTNYPRFKEGDLAITGGQTGGVVELIPRKRCEELRPQRSCEGLLPGFSSEVSHAVENVIHEKFSVIESINARAGFYSYTCLFQFKGTIEMVSEDEEIKEVFRGVVAVASNVSRYSSVAQAVTQMEAVSVLEGAGALSISGIGEEAKLLTKTEANSKGEQEYLGYGFVRVDNVVAWFELVGDEEADEASTRTLLAQVASEL